jgi:hypothetical protein
MLWFQHQVITFTQEPETRLRLLAMNRGSMATVPIYIEHLTKIPDRAN